MTALLRLQKLLQQTACYPNNDAESESAVSSVNKLSHTEADQQQQPIVVVFITGCSRGIGYALVEYFLCQRTQYYVISSCRTPSTAHKLQALLSKHPRRAYKTPICLDISKQESICRAYQTITTELQIQHIDILINNAAMSTKGHPYESVLDFDANEMQQMLATNVIGTASVSKIFFNLLKTEKQNNAQLLNFSRVINVSSELSSLTRAFSGAQEGNSKRMTTTSYRLTKVAINMLTRLQAGELSREHGILFVSISPGWVATDLGSSQNRQAPLTVDYCVTRFVPFIEKLDIDIHTGNFYDLHGKVLPW